MHNKETEFHLGNGDFINIKFANNESFYRISSLKALEISKSCLGESSLFFNDKKLNVTFSIWKSKYHS